MWLTWIALYKKSISTYAHDSLSSLVKVNLILRVKLHEYMCIYVHEIKGQ